MRSSETVATLSALSLCQAGRAIDAWSRAVFLIVGLMFLLGQNHTLPWIAVMLGNVALGVCEAYHAARLAFDQPIFAAWSQLDDDTLSESIAAFDARRILGGQAVRANRPLSDRVLGVRRLFFGQIASFLGQIVLLCISIGFMLSYHA